MLRGGGTGLWPQPRWLAMSRWVTGWLGEVSGQQHKEVSISVKTGSSGLLRGKMTSKNRYGERGNWTNIFLMNHCKRALLSGALRYLGVELGWPAET